MLSSMASYISNFRLIIPQKMTLLRRIIYPRWRKTKTTTLVISCVLLALVLLLLHRGTDLEDSLVVAIVEEHHEVIPYWFDAVDKGHVPRNRNTLIHIDAHSDGAIPRYHAGFPFFSAPKTDRQVKMLMQKNDVFIQGAAITGLLSRVIWIWPSWDTDQDTAYEETLIEQGWLTIKPDKDIKEVSFCACITNKTGTKECFYVDEDATDINDTIVLIPQNHCQVSRSYVNENVNDRVALEKTDTGEWITAQDHVILDIDEDFFGTQSGIELLLKVGVSSKLIKLLNMKLQKLFCVHNVQYEESADQLLKDCVALSFQKCNWDPETSKCQMPVGHVYRNTLGLIIDGFRTTPSMFCVNKTTALRKAWFDIQNILYYMYPDHLRALLKTGFCLTTSPMTYGFAEGRKGHFVVCHGRNLPNETLISLHSLSTNELNYESKVVFELVKSINAISPPKLVTVCRSVRDGYTQRSVAADIERRIMLILEKSGHPQKVQRVYDSNLLGGRAGWRGRYKPHM